MYDTIIIGAGPAGISAAIYAKRANLNVLVLFNDNNNNINDDIKIENYYGFQNGISLKDLKQNGINQAKNLGVELENCEVTSINNVVDSFEVETPKKSFNAKTIIIATGTKKQELNIKGLKEFEGRGVSYCAICDSFFFKNKTVSVIGNGEFALSEIKTIKNVTNDIKILTNGEKTSDLINEYINGTYLNDEKSYDGEKNIKIINKKIKEIIGDTKVKEVLFEDGTKINSDGIFVATNEADGTDLAKILGLTLYKDRYIKVNENMETNIKGVFACGNITGGLLQINKAVYEGAKAGLEANKYIKNILGGKNNG